MKKNLFLLGLLSIMVFGLCSCSNDKEEDEVIGDNKVPTLLYGKWDGSNSKGQHLTFIVYKDGTCAYQRLPYVDATGSYAYDETEKRITTTISEIGEGAIVYIIELLDADNLVVKKEANNIRTSYTKDHSFSVD